MSAGVCHLQVRAKEGAGCEPAGVGADKRVHRATFRFPQNPVKGRLLEERSSLCFLWSENSSFYPQMEEAHPPPFPVHWTEGRR